MGGTDATARLRSALAARDVDGVVAATSERVVVEVEGGPVLVGHPALRAWLDDLRAATADSRWHVHVASRTASAAPVVEDEVTLAWRPAGEGTRWVVASAAVRAEVAAGGGPVSHARVRVDRGAVAAQLAGATRLPASSVRSDVALATFDPGAPAPVPLERVLEAPPPPPRRRRRGAAVLVGALVALVVLAALLLAGVLPGADRVLGPSARDGPAEGPGPSPGPPSEPTEPAGPTGPTGPAEPSPGPAQAAGPSPESTALLGAGAVVDDDTGTVTLSLSETVLFDPGSSELRPEAVAVVDDVAATLLDADGGELLVVGHTDSVGSDAYNLRLSRERAESVAAVLRADLAGTPVTVRSEGRGSAEPVADEDTAEGRQANRRVELRFEPPGG